MNTPISVFIVTLNEIEYISDVLDSVQCFDEIILVDSGSDDGTVEVARQKGVKVIHQSWEGFAKQKSFAMSQCKNDWVLNIDGDEILPQSMCADIQNKVNSGKYDILKLYFEDIFWGLPMSKYSSKRSIYRVFNKSFAKYPTDRLVHENVVFSKNARTMKVRGKVKHFGYKTTHKLVMKQNDYSTLKAKEKAVKGVSPSLIKLLAIFPLTFIKSYVFQGMLWSGKRGIVHAHIEAIYAFLKEAKLFENTSKSDNSK